MMKTIEQNILKQIQSTSKKREHNFKDMAGPTKKKVK